MSSSFRRHRDLRLDPPDSPVTPLGVQEAERVRRPREIPALVTELTEALDARALAEAEQSTFRVLNEAYAPSHGATAMALVADAFVADALVSAEQSADVGALVTMIEESPVEFALLFRDLQQRMADVEQKQRDLSARVGP